MADHFQEFSASKALFDGDRRWEHRFDGTRTLLNAGDARRMFCWLIPDVVNASRASQAFEAAVFDENRSRRTMSTENFTEILQAIESGDRLATDRLLPIVYNELRQLASIHLAREQPGQTLQATALVHEAYVRLIGTSEPTAWNSRAHFFGAAAQAMRRILIDHAREKKCLKRGREWQRLDLDDQIAVEPPLLEDLLALDDALKQLKEVDPRAVELVQLRYFAGLTVDEAADAMGISSRKAGSLWFYARAWLRDELEKDFCDH